MEHRLFGTAAHVVAQVLTGLPARMKAPAFAAEEEWRLVTYEIEGLLRPPGFDLPDSPTKIRSRGSRLVAYKEIRFNPDDFSVRTLLPATSVHRSSVPVRPK
jgi:hypothetical protein